MSMDNIPLSEALRYTAMAAGLELTFEEHAVVLTRTAKASVSCEVSVAPADEPQQYAVQFKLSEGGNVLSAPRIAVLAGNEGVIRVGSENRPGVRCTALVTEHPDGSASAHTTIRHFDDDGALRFYVVQDVKLNGKK